MIPEFFRGPVWISEEARRAWEPRLKAASALWQVLERASVEHGLRRSCLLMVHSSELPAVSQWAAKIGKQVAVLGACRLSGSYSAGNAATGVDGFKVAVTPEQNVADWHRAYQENDNELIGALLGFPKCCRDFFAETWGKGSRDGTMQMKSEEFEPLAVSNILLRWLGIRFVPHLPCSSFCRETDELAIEMAGLGDRLGFRTQVAEALEILNWPMTYTTLHGVCEVTTPVLKFCASSDYFATKRVVKREGVFNKLEPPHPMDKVQYVSYSDRLERADIHHDHSGHTEECYHLPEWALNGFSSLEAMTKSHRIVLDAAASLVKRGPLLDLGCGTGRLVADAAGISEIEIYGVDINDKALAVAHQKYSRAKDRFRKIPIASCLNQKDWPACFEVAFLMPGRILEMPVELAHHFRQQLKRYVRYVVVYAYSDWLAKYPGGLEELCLKAGLPSPLMYEGGAGVISTELM